MMWTFGVGQLIVYTLGLPLLVFVFLWRNRSHLQNQIPMTRYGLFYGAYKSSRFYWEVVITARKVSIVMLSVFGPAMGPALQAQVALLIFLICIVAEIYGDPYAEPTEDHKLLRRLELCSLLVQWLTMWSGLVIFQLKEESAVAIVLTIFVVGGTSVLLLWSLYQFVRAKIRENREEKRLKREREALEVGVAGAQGQRASIKSLIMLGMGAPNKRRWIKSLMMSEEKRQARTRSRTFDSSDPANQSSTNPLVEEAVVNIEMPVINREQRKKQAQARVRRASEMEMSANESRSIVAAAEDELNALAETSTVSANPMRMQASM